MIVCLEVGPRTVYTWRVPYLNNFVLKFIPLHFELCTFGPTVDFWLTYWAIELSPRIFVPMVVLDIVSICLIDSPRLLEDLSTPVGRIWDDILCSTREKEGNLSTSWGRLHQELHTVLLCTGEWNMQLKPASMNSHRNADTVWVDRKCRNEFHHAGQGLTAVNCFLRHPIKIRYVLPTGNAQVSPARDLVDSLQQDGLAILIVSLRENSDAHIQHEMGHVWDEFKR